MTILNQTKFLFFVLIIIVSGCISIRNTPAKLITPLYALSIEDTAYPSADEITNTLYIISKQNPKLKWKTIEGKEHLLVATWTNEKSKGYYPVTGIYNTKGYPVWVTAIPDLKERCDALKIEKSNDPDLRIKQLLGLPPTADKSHFIEFWVQAKDLFRPCPDAETSDNTCGLCFPEDIDKTNENHKKWINDLRLSSYYNCKGDKYPWTQLGYTYDWHPRNKSHIGLSEFVIKANSDIYVHKIEKTKTYLGF